MNELVDLIVAITFVLLFILYISYNTINDKTKPKHQYNKDKPLMRGVIHTMTSFILPIIYAFMPSNNFSIETMILCCSFSSIFHNLATMYDGYYFSTLRLMDYLGSDITILTYPMILFERHNDTIWINRMPLVIAVLCICEFIHFYYHYHIQSLGRLCQLSPHILCLIFALYPVIKYSDYTSPWFLLMISLYFVSFYFFVTIDEDNPEHYIWSQHETFHLILLFAFIVHIYISL